MSIGKSQNFIEESGILKHLESLNLEKHERCRHDQTILGIVNEVIGLNEEFQF